MSTSLVLNDLGAAAMLAAYFNNSFPASKTLTLKLFCNNITPGDTDTTATYTEASGGGYAAVSLTNGSWTVSNVGGDRTGSIYSTDIHIHRPADNQRDDLRLLCNRRGGDAECNLCPVTQHCNDPGEQRGSVKDHSSIPVIKGHPGGIKGKTCSDSIPYQATQYLALALLRHKPLRLSAAAEGLRAAQELLLLSLFNRRRVAVSRAVRPLYL